jgi:hypothetical protein
MATVDKNFRIKNGLVVEGTTATVNGNDILTKNTQDGDSYIINLIGGTATSENTANAVVKRDQNGDFAAGSITVNELTIDGAGSITNNGDDFRIQTNEGGDFDVYADDVYFSAQDDIRLEANDLLRLTSTNGGIHLDAANAYFGTFGDTSARIATEGYVDAAQTAAANDATDKATTAENNAKAYADGLAPNYDPAGSASTAYTNAVADAQTFANAAYTNAEAYADGILTQANGYTDSAIGTEVGDRNSAISTALTTAQGYANTAEQNAKDYADDLINDASTSSSEVWSAYKTSTEIGLAQAAAEQHADDAVAALVGSAPAVLDTIQELATALENNPDIIADLENVAAGKQNTLTAGSNIDITADVISVTGLDSADISDFNTAALSATSAAYDAAGAASAAQTAAQSYADGLASNYDAAGSASTAQTAAEGHADDLASDILDGTSAFTEINVNDLVSQRAAQGLVATAQNGSSMMSWAKADYGTAKAWVKFATATHSQISEFLLTTDSSGNIAITEFGMVTSNGTLGSVGASYLNGNIAIEVDTVHAATTVTVVATLIK